MPPASQKPELAPENQPLERYRNRHNFGKWAQRDKVLADQKKKNRKKNKAARKARSKS